eukprot:jgi/Chlat1/5278/Chrsp35S05238
MAAAAAGSEEEAKAAAAAASPTSSSAAVTTTNLPMVPPGLPLSPSGLLPSAIVKGCWQLSGGHRGERDTDRTAGREAVQDFEKFVEAGITTFDTADIYGPSESLIGRYLSTLRKKSGVAVFTKMCLFGQDQADPTFEFVRRKVEGSRERMGVERIDMVQFYWQDYSIPNYVTAAKHLSTLQAQGRIRAIGVTNFDVPRMREMMDAGVQYSLLDRRPENGMVDFCRENNVKLLPYGVVAGGFLSDKYLGKTFAEARKDINTYSKQKYASVINQVGGWDWFQDLLGVLRSVADRHNASVSNVATRWVLQRPSGVVAAAIVGARNAAHVDDHRRAFAFELSKEDLARIDEVLEKGKRSRGDCYTWERGGVF